MMTEVKYGVLYIDGVSVPEIAKQFGTPCYIMSEDTVRKNCRKYMDAAEKYYGKNALPLYASKAFSCVDIYKTVASEGFGADVVSGGELYTALKAASEESLPITLKNLTELTELQKN